MTLADQFREEGLQKGRQEGLQKGLQDGILEALQIRFGQIPEGLAEAIRQVLEEAHLRTLHRAAIQADSIENFAKNL
jgi:predicted transposase YdaD